METQISKLTEATSFIRGRVSSREFWEYPEYSNYEALKLLLSWNSGRDSV